MFWVGVSPPAKDYASIAKGAGAVEFHRRRLDLDALCRKSSPYLIVGGLASFWFASNYLDNGVDESLRIQRFSNMRLETGTLGPYHVFLVA
jgi:hypothetical protein